MMGNTALVDFIEEKIFDRIFGKVLLIEVHLNSLIFKKTPFLNQCINFDLKCFKNIEKNLALHQCLEQFFRKERLNN